MLRLGDLKKTVTLEQVQYEVESAVLAAGADSGHEIYGGDLGYISVECDAQDRVDVEYIMKKLEMVAEEPK